MIGGYTAFKFLLADGIVEFYILADFLSSFIINCWEKPINISNYVYLTSYSFSSIHFCFTDFVVLLFGAYTITLFEVYSASESIFHVSYESWDVFSLYLFGNLLSLSSSSSPLEPLMI